MNLLSPSLRRLALAAVGGLLAASTVQAQTPDKKTALSANVGLLQYHGNLGSDFWKIGDVDSEAGVGIGLTRYLSPSFDLGVFGFYENYKFSGTRLRPSSLDARVGFANLGLKLKLNNGKILKEESFIQPYLMGGAGGMFTNTSGVVNGRRFSDKIRRPDVFGTAGLRFRLSPALALELTTTYIYPLTDNFDNTEEAIDDRNDRFLLHQAGLVLAFGEKKDADKDGVADRKDKCPDTPAGVAVDPNGCPLDKDGDGVADYQDKCPDEKGVAALQGCPDRDGDGVADADDACPDTPGKAELRGCPDADNDGVRDQDDKCPNTPAGVSVDATGCPTDKDGDGVPDYQDKCPDRAGPASNQGCPEIKAESRKVLDEATRYIQFEFNKARLLPVSNARLDQIVTILNENPDYSLSISGHTDNVGVDAYNLRLSYDRAAAVRTYILGKGVSATRIESRGYGETKPTATNKTKAGQALNRRVEFAPYLTGEANPDEAKYGPAVTLAELEAQGKAAPTVKKKAPARKAPARRPAPRRK
ncbi:OmpA family protein [uncultured Hymenobacter sp.]|uniref:OmpA family protein n=1 Tax=uncultured Hymenobacter sp. TaxID=170016 RepID=UPI0035C97A4D